MWYPLKSPIECNSRSFEEFYLQFPLSLASCLKVDTQSRCPERIYLKLIYLPKKKLKRYNIHEMLCK